MRVNVVVAAIIAIALLGGCGNRNRVAAAPTSIAITGTGDEMPAPANGVGVVDAGRPLAAFDVYLDGFQFANGRPHEQHESHHYCDVVDDDFQQCVLFDGSGAHARLVGIEYVVSSRLFERLPLAERGLWHSHAYEVSSGLLVAPGLSEPAEHEFMAHFAGTYGKTWHTWHSPRDEHLPIGIPTLMAGFTDDDQVESGLVAARDRRLDIDTVERRLSRNDIHAPLVLDGADAWQDGPPLQLMLHPLVASSPARSEAEPAQDEGIQAPRRRSPESRKRDVFAGLGRSSRD